MVGGQSLSFVTSLWDDESWTIGSRVGFGANLPSFKDDFQFLGFLCVLSSVDLNGRICVCGLGRACSEGG